MEVGRLRIPLSPAKKLYVKQERGVCRDEPSSDTPRAVRQFRRNDQRPLAALPHGRDFVGAKDALVPALDDFPRSDL
jgi:hypothetical protein